MNNADIPKKTQTSTRTAKHNKDQFSLNTKKLDINNAKNNTELKAPCGTFGIGFLAALRCA
ncbi:hypothetical protein [Marinomonas primoryensis]|uniref:hypothetical protein n=1 Tax=Marinomonas primoryensis TaxID=178399 RepID=UPI001EF83679|nr:hypothetical protein [Marinomonas primoryensis]